jgi:hypothetical protein
LKALVFVADMVSSAAQDNAGYDQEEVPLGEVPEDALEAALKETFGKDIPTIRQSPVKQIVDVSSQSRVGVGPGSL